MLQPAKTRVITLAGLLLGAGILAQADVIFDFNSLSSGANNSSIQTYMNGVLGCAGCVTVTGAVADRTYNGEGYVTGPGNGSKSLTLGTSDGAAGSNSNSTVNSTYDTFLANTNDSSHQISNQIVIRFGSGYALNGPISFDYEIFPDISGSPDFTFKAWNGSTLLASWTQLGVTPNTTDGNATHSPKHPGPSGTETNKQYMGTWSSGAPLNNVTELDFIDWPATIGVDNLKIASAPEPGTLLLFGTGLAALFCFRKRLRSAVAQSSSSEQ